MTISRSPERHTFQLENYLKRCQDNGKEPSQAYIEMYENAKQDDLEFERDSEQHKGNLEYDLRSTGWILEKVRGSDAYAQNLYAALCNNDFQQMDVYQILADKTWSCSWRYAGGIIADMQQTGDYIDWYCSGIRGEMDDEEFHHLTKEQQERYLYVKNNYVAESVVTDEIRDDLKKLGWIVVDTEPEAF